MSKSPLPSLSLTPEPVSRLIQLFEERADVLQFPDTDAATLSAAVAEMENERAAVDKASANLDQARKRLAEVQQLLLDKARQAHAYASVYALEDEDMQLELAKIKMGSVQRTARKRKPMQKEAPPTKSASTTESPSNEDKSPKSSDENGS